MTYFVVCVHITLQKLKDEHEQLNEDYSVLARENLKLRDKFQSSQQKLTELRERTSVEVLMALFFTFYECESQINISNYFVFKFLVMTPKGFLYTFSKLVI